MRAEDKLRADVKLKDKALRFVGQPSLSAMT